MQGKRCDAIFIGALWQRGGEGQTIECDEHGTFDILRPSHQALQDVEDLFVA